MQFQRRRKSSVFVHRNNEKCKENDCTEEGYKSNLCPDDVFGPEVVNCLNEVVNSLKHISLDIY
jgi:hypothetical protein